MPSRRRHHRRPWWLPWTFAVVLVLALVAAAVFFRTDLQQLAARVLSPSPSAPAATPLPSGTASAPPEILAPVTGGTPPDAAVVKARLAAIGKAKVGTTGGVVLDAATGALVYADNDAAFLPASTLKLLTAVAVLDVLDPQTRFDTTVVSAGPGRIVLVGGGDPFLVTTAAAAATFPERASLEALAAATATSLKQSGVATVALGYDASLFSGEAWHPSWTSAYAWGVAPVSALMTDRAVTTDGRRFANPAAQAAKLFAEVLAKQGVAVRSVKAEAAPPAAAVVAKVRSMTLAQLVTETLLTSDNDAAEALFRHAAVGSGRPGTFAEAAAVAQARLEALGVWGSGTVMADGSGLSRSSAVKPSTLAGLIRLALATPRFRSLLDGLPVAGATGTLQDRFVQPAEIAGRGVVRAKTGTLRAVANVAGYLVTADGAVLSFALMSNGYTDVRAAYDWLATSAATLAACGCRA